MAITRQSPDIPAGQQEQRAARPGVPPPVQVTPVGHRQRSSTHHVVLAVIRDDGDLSCMHRFIGVSGRTELVAQDARAIWSCLGRAGTYIQPGL